MCVSGESVFRGVEVTKEGGVEGGEAGGGVEGGEAGERRRR